MVNVRFMRLWDLYGKLLTVTQQEISGLYFNLDLTVSEIAEQKGISRQAVSDCLAGCKKQLEAYEDKLGFLKTLEGYAARERAFCGNVVSWGNDFFLLHPEYAADKAQLEGIVKGFKE